MEQTTSMQSTAARLQRIPWALHAIHVLWRHTRPRYTAGVVGVLFNLAGEVLLVDHVFHTAPTWGLPGGYLNRRENPDRALARELREELALSVMVGPIVWMERAYGDHLDIAYVCRAHNEIGTLSNELAGCRWTRRDALPPLRPFHHAAIARAAALLPSLSDEFWT